MNSESVDISRSGRVRKKSSKLIDFESPDEVEKTLKRLPKTAARTATTGAVGRPIRSRTSGSISNDNENSDYMEDDDDEDFEMGSVYGGSDEELDDMVADMVEEVKAESFNQDNNPKSKVQNSLYMSEKSNKRKILKDGKIITSKRTERKDKGKSRFTAYSLWAREFRKTSKFSKNQDLDFSNASRRLGELWANVSNKEKSAWRRKAKIQATKAKARELATESNSTTVASSSTFMNRATTSRTRKLAAERQKTPPLLLASPNSSKRTRYNSQRSSTSTSALGSHEAIDGFLNSNYLPSANNSNISSPKTHQLPNIEPIDAAAHLKLLGESLSIIGERLKEHEGQIALSGSLSVLLDSILCSLGPLMCLTPFIPGLGKRPQLNANLASTLDNIAYVMPGL